MVEGKAQAKADIEPGGSRYHQEAQSDRKRKAKAKMRDDDSRRLSSHRQPAQAHQRIDTQATGPPAKIDA